MDLLEAAESVIDTATDRDNQPGWVFVRREDFLALKEATTVARSIVDVQADREGYR